MHHHNHTITPNGDRYCLSTGIHGALFWYKFTPGTGWEDDTGHQYFHPPTTWEPTPCDSTG